MTELQEKIESFQNLLVDIATSGNRKEEEENFTKLRTYLISNNEIKNHLPDFVKTNRTVSQFWQFIKSKFSGYAERRTFIWDEFAKTFDFIESKKNNINDQPSTIQSQSKITLKDSIINVLEKQLNLGNTLLTNLDFVSDSTELDNYIITYNNWSEFNNQLFENGYVSPQLAKTYIGVSTYLGNVYVDSESFRGKREKILHCLPKQLAHLKSAISQTQISRNTDLLPIEDSKFVINKLKNNTQNMSKLFISHSSIDLTLIKPLIDLVENIGVPHNKIFFSSHPSYGVSLGENIFTRLKTELEENVFALFMLSDNFYNSPVCLCEMGAVWIKSNKQIPILIPPFEFNSVQGVFPNSLGFKMNDKQQLNNFKAELESHFNLTPISISRWEEKRDEYLEKINTLLNIASH